LRTSIQAVVFVWHASSLKVLFQRRALMRKTFFRTGGRKGKKWRQIFPSPPSSAELEGNGENGRNNWGGPGLVNRLAECERVFACGRARLALKSPGVASDSSLKPEWAAASGGATGRPAGKRADGDDEDDGDGRGMRLAAGRRLTFSRARARGE